MNENDIRAAIAWLKKKKAVEKVLYLNQVQSNPKLAFDREYQRKFVGYYRVRQKPAAFYTTFFQLLHDVAREPEKWTLARVLQHLFDAGHGRHLSFGSKLLVTAGGGNAVVFDRNVGSHFGVPTGVLPAANWQNEAQSRHDAVRAQLESFAGKAAGQRAIKLFDAAFPTAVGLPTLRKLDLIIWAHVALDGP